MISTLYSTAENPPDRLPSAFIFNNWKALVDPLER